MVSLGIRCQPITRSLIALQSFAFHLLTFGCFTLSRQERSPLVPLGQQDALGVLAAHFAKVPSGGGEAVGQFSGTSLITCCSQELLAEPV